MRVKFFRGSLCFLALAFSLYFPRLPGVIAQAAQADRFSTRVEVELVTAEVVVLDKKGKPVHNLKKEDFRLYEDGKQQEISSFDEVNGEPGQAPAAAFSAADSGVRKGKTVFILFDDRTITTANLKKTRDAAERFVKEHMRPQDLFAVASNDISFRILQNFTDDPEKIVAAIRRGAVPGGAPASMGMRTASGSGIDFMRTLGYLSRSVERIRGRKSILLFSESLAMFESSENQNQYLKTIDSAKRSNTAFFTIEPLEMSFSDSTGDMGGQGFLRSLASETGGLSIYDAADLSEALDELDQRLSNYYILGFQSGNPKRDGSFRKLEVKTDLKGVTLKYRKGYVDRRPLDVLTNSKQEKSLIDAMASPSTATRLPIAFRAIYFYDSPRLARVLVSARIGLENAEFKKKGGQLACDVNVMGAAHAGNDTVSARFSETVHVIIDKEQNPGKDLVYSNYFKLRPGKYRLKLAASDEANNLGSTEQLLEIPVLPENELAGSSLVVAERATPLPDLIQNLESKLLDDSDPLVYGGMEISPIFEDRIPVKSLLAVLFKLYNPKGDLEHWKAVAKARLVKSSGEELTLAPIAVEQNLSQNTEATIALNLPFQGVVPGKYKLVIETTEAASSRTATVQTDLEFTQ